MLLRDCRIDRRFLLTKASVYLVLKRLYWRVSVLIQTVRRIDRQCPLSDRRITECYCLRSISSPIHLVQLEIAMSVHPTVPWLSRSVPTHPTIAPTLAIKVLSVHPTVSFHFLSLLGSTDAMLFLGVGSSGALHVT
jgi:hypothetical protein